jgi:riboflavin kinase/FMN adenylyltransferase
MASTPAREFAAKCVAGEFRARHVVCGFNFTFGYRGAGTPQDLRDWGKGLGFSVHIVPRFVAGGDAVSSTRVRTALEAGDVALATLCLGRPYGVAGSVAAGDGRGRRIGIPTSNLAVPGDKVLPGNAVYSAVARVASRGSAPAAQVSPAVVNVGTRPTFDGSGVRVEAHIPGFEGELYGRHMQVFFLERLRDERRFRDAGALKAQVEADIKRALAASGKAPSFTLPGAYDRMLALEIP